MQQLIAALAQSDPDRFALSFALSFTPDGSCTKRRRGEMRPQRHVQAVYC